MADTVKDAVIQFYRVSFFRLVERGRHPSTLPPALCWCRGCQDVTVVSPSGRAACRGSSGVVWGECVSLPAGYVQSGGGSLAFCKESFEGAAYSRQLPALSAPTHSHVIS